MGVPRVRGGAGKARPWLEAVSRWGTAALAGVAGAVAAGTVPDVIKGWLGEQRLFLTGLCLVSALMFAGINLWQQRSRGVGIVISLRQSTWRGPWSRQWVAAASDHARRHHDSCFLVRREIPAPRTGDGAAALAAVRRARRDELELTYELVAARLIELSEADPSTPVSLYVNAALPDAFELGAMFKFNVQRRLQAIGGDPTRPGRRAEIDHQSAQSTPVEISDPPEISELPVSFVLPQPSEQAQADFFPAIRISSRLKEPLSTAEAARAAELARVVAEPDFAAAPEGTAVALVVHLADNPLMVTQALQAAADGCTDSAGRWARCRAVLLIDGGPANVPETTADFELAVRHIYAAWRGWIRARPQYAQLHPRLFIAAPAAVTFALGWLIGHSMTPVPHPYQTSDETGDPCTSS